jgi:hypothetical protein
LNRANTIAANPIAKGLGYQANGIAASKTGKPYCGPARGSTPLGPRQSARSRPAASRSGVLDNLGDPRFPM